MFLSTTFSRLAFFIQEQQLTGSARFVLYRLRAELRKFDEAPSSFPNRPELLDFADSVFDWMANFLESGHPGELMAASMPEVFRSMDTRTDGFIRSHRFLLVGQADDPGTYFALDENRPELEVLIRLPEHPCFTTQDLSQHFGTVIPFPLFIQAFDIEISKETYSPGYYVVMPDYLVDVTAVAGGFQNNGFSIWPYFVRRVMPTDTTYYMLLGNIVNHALDQVIINENFSLEDFFAGIFSLFPLDILPMDDEEVRKLLVAIKKHVGVLKKVVNSDFEKLEIQPRKCELEPTFLSSQYGLQGRLDVLHREKETTIIELKSGRPYRPNSYGIKADHYVQTLLYDLMIRSAGISDSPRNFILYSSQEDKPLRYAPPVKAIQIQALKARNEIVLLDAMLRHEEPDITERLFEAFDRKVPDGHSSFLARDIERFRLVKHSASELEWKYYLLFYGFTMREMAIAKVGLHGRDNASGLASVWLKDENEKLMDFGLLSHLIFEYYRMDDGSVYLTFSFSEKTDPLANFRKGDVVLLYPNNGTSRSALKNQVHKSSLVERDHDRIILRLRSKQYDEDFFRSNQWWNVERDVLDSSFNSSFDSLFLFLGAPEGKRKLLLGLIEPEKGSEVVPDQFAFSSNLLPEQVATVRKIYNVLDYFLLWGPPGTGKTSVMIRELVRLYFETTDKDIYLLAYTNRAVDELCAVITGLGGTVEEQAVRVGSGHNCAEPYRKLLFDKQISGISDRQDLGRFIHGKRIFISTLASFWGRRQLIKEVGKGILIVDEASQILEPSLIGLLPYFEKFILVGDHLQLPAVSVQTDKSGEIKDPGLKTHGFSNMKISLFERLFSQLGSRSLDSHRAILRHQGRMHRSIMDFVNGEFYEGGLELVPELPRLLSDDPRIKGLDQRMLYIPSEANPEDPMIKNNSDEADKVVAFIQYWMKANNIEVGDLNEADCGVITPYRAQIALIKFRLNEIFGPSAEKISVDTVERYQGSARNVVIISLCLNRVSQLRTVVNESAGGVDRKFNVALTRAKDHVVVIGDETIMSRARSYAAYIKMAHRMDDELEDVISMRHVEEDK